MPNNADLDQALTEAHEAYVKANPRSLARHIEAMTVMPGGNTRTVLHYAPFPMAVARAAGCRLISADGDTYLDFLGDYTAGLYGHSDKVIRAAIDTALDDGISFGAANMVEAKFAAVIAERFPAMRRLRFTNSGTEANIMALAAACAVTGRRRILAFRGGYHGGVLGFATEASKTNIPYDVTLARYNDIEGARAAMTAIGADLAAVILEPMLGSGGCIPASDAFLEMLREETIAAGALLILDEVMTSRLGPRGLGAEYGITPDLMTLGKYIGGGLSCGAFGGREEIMNGFDPKRPGAWPHAGTFNNNILTMSAGYAGLTEVYTEAAALELNARGEALRRRLNAIGAEAEVAMQFTGIGSMFAVHFTRAAITAPADDAGGDRLKELFFFDLLARGIWIARRGMSALSLPIGEDECAQCAEAVESFVQTRRSLLVG